MTLSTAAEHRDSRREPVVRDAVMDVIKPESAALEAVMELEGSKDDPAVIDDPKWAARKIADNIEQEALRAARGWDLSGSSKESIAIDVANDAYEVALGTIMESPLIEVGDQ